MNKAILSFFVTPDEQRAWLRGVLREESVFGLLDERPSRRFATLDDRMLASFKFEGKPYLTRMYLGRHDIAPTPVWRVVAGHTELDFARSQLVQFVPGMAQGNDLFEGQIGIMRKNEYERLGVPHAELSRWFRHLVGDFKRLIEQHDVNLVSRDPDGSTHLSRLNAILSSGAVKWRGQGGRLRQLPESRIEFDVVSTSE